MRKALPLLIVFLISISCAYAMSGCAEKTKAGEWCVYTTEDNVAEGAKFTPTNCEQTSYCKIGCCYSSDEGRCFKNTPHAACTAEGAAWKDDPSCSIDQCSKGCCMIGDQAFFVTEVKCKQTATLYPDVQMNYNKDIKSERECVDTSKSRDLGCCVKADGCAFTTMSGCEAASEPITGNITETKKAAQGFYKDMLCSNDQLNCGCAKQQTTGCVGEDVYWFDSCGNRENIYNADKTVSYNSGLILKEESSCTATAGDTNCGNCDYSAGSVCGADTEKRMPVGSSICIGMGCKATFKDTVSPNANGNAKKNGESWCVFDSAPGFGRDLVGSRYYRHLCINGEEMVEPCKDFREEICVQGKLGEEALRNIPALTGSFGTGDYVEAGCRDNRNENCFACNAYLSDEEEKSGLTPTIIEKRKQCCNNEDVRDCYWMPAVIQPARITSEGKIQLDGTCVPQVPPGLKFWGDESAAASAAATSTSAPGAEAQTPSTPAQQKCEQASSECTVTYFRSGLESLMGDFGIGIKKVFLIGAGSADFWTNEDGGWKIVKNRECTDKKWVVAGNEICRSVGDCGAYYNIRGKLTFDGYINTLVDETDYGVSGKTRKLTAKDIGTYDKLIVQQGGKVPGFIDKGGGWWVATTALTFMFSGDSGGLGGSITGALGQIPAIGPVMGMLGGIVTKVTDVVGGFASGLFGLNTWSAEDIAIEGFTGELEEGAKVIVEEGEINLGGTAGTTVSREQFSSLQERGVINSEGVVQETPDSGIGGYISGYMWIRQIMQAIDIFAAETQEETYTITCQPWQPPTGGADCESCNEEMKPCSEYKCKSLGAACTLVNQGTSNETCVAMDVNDVNSPIIKPWKGVLTPPFTLAEVNEQGNPGFKINEKVKPFNPIHLGIILDEPATCKYNIVPGTKFDNMPAQFGSSLMLYNQSVAFSLPSELAQQNATKVNRGNYKMYVRCKDANGNKNEKDYFIQFTIDDSPDLTPPTIKFTTLQNDAFVSAGTTQVAFSMYVDEYAECKYSRRDTEFEQMENIFDCKNTMFGQSSLYFGTFECSTILTNLTRTTNVFFIRCSDQPGLGNRTRNVMGESYKFTIKGSEPLNITSAGPSGDLYTNDVNMKVTTFKGAENGKATCGFSANDVPFGSMIGFAKTGETAHEQAFTDMDKGDYKYYISCMDKAGNEAKTNVQFKVTVDNLPPMITSVFIDSAFGMLHMEFDETCTCEYSPDKPSFAFGEGTLLGNANSTVHESQVTGNVFYVKCKDIFDNKGEYTIYKETASSTVDDFFF